MRHTESWRIATNGAEALAILRADFHPCVILLDVFMPVMDGMHFLEIKRTDPALAPIPVIVITGTVTDHPEFAHASAFLPKPLDFAELLAVVSEHCGNAEGGSH